MNPNTISTLFAGQEAMATMVDGTTHLMRVRELPARHHLELLELFHVGREADLIQRCAERCAAEEAGERKWEKVDAAFVDGLTDESHQQLADLCQTLNFSRAIKTAQRQIARGQELRPLMEKMSATMFAPLRQELASWTSSLTQQLSSALAAKPPSEKP